MSKKWLRKRNVTVADTVRSLMDNGISITEKDAEDILDFLYLLAEIAVDQYIKKEKKQH